MFISMMTDTTKYPFIAPEVVVVIRLIIPGLTSFANIPFFTG